MEQRLRPDDAAAAPGRSYRGRAEGRRCARAPSSSAGNRLGLRLRHGCAVSLLKPAVSAPEEHDMRPSGRSSRYSDDELILYLCCLIPAYSVWDVNKRASPHIVQKNMRFLLLSLLYKRTVLSLEILSVL